MRVKISFNTEYTVYTLKKVSLFTIFLSSILWSSASEGEGGEKEKGANKAYEIHQMFTKNLMSPRELDSLEEEVNLGKNVPEMVKLPFLYAFSRYPELQNVEIEFVKKPIKTTMAARPAPFSLLGSKEDRKYRIFINTDEERLPGMLFSDLSFNARVGVLAHELAHILDYEKRSMWGVMRYGWKYLSASGRSDLEKRTDKIAIERGFGWQVLSFNEHLYRCSNVPLEYKRYKKEHYFSFKDILRILRESPLYAME